MVEQRDRSNNTPPETVNLAQAGEPTVSLNFSTATLAQYDSPEDLSGELEVENLLNDDLIEGYPYQGSVLNLDLETEGEIPEEGVLVTVNSDGYLRDYFTVRFLQEPPFTPGSELVDVVTDDTGGETGFQLRIFEPVTFVSLVARTPYRADFGLVEPGPDSLQPSPEMDGTEVVTFFLEGGEGYGVSETASQVTPTFYDNEEQAPEPSVIPEVSMTISETELIESEGTETTLNFSLSEAPPEEGTLVYVKSETAGVLSQFDIFNTEVTGGVFPTANGNVSGFYFQITKQEASINLAPFPDPFDEGLQSFSLALQEAPMYTIDEDASQISFTIADTPDSVLEISLSSEEVVAIESDDTAGVLTFNLSALPLAGGVEVTVDADNLSEFDAEALTVTGGEITEITETGFSLNITEATARVEVPALSDEEAEGVETASFSLVESADYLSNPEATVAAVTLVDIPEQVPSPTAESTSNNTIGTYYVGVSQLSNDDYDPLVDAALPSASPDSSGWIFPEIGVYYGEYELNAELVSDGGGDEPTFEVVKTFSVLQA